MDKKMIHILSCRLTREWKGIILVSSLLAHKLTRSVEHCTGNGFILSGRMILFQGNFAVAKIAL